MADSQQVAVAKAALQHLIDADILGSVRPVRSYADWDLVLDEAGRLHVDVAAVTTEQAYELASRGAVKYTVPIDIAVRRRLELQNTQPGAIQDCTPIDELTLVVEQIFEAFGAQRLTGFTAGVWKETKILANPIRKMLRESRQFTGIVRVTFVTNKDL